MLPFDAAGHHVLDVHINPREAQSKSTAIEVLRLTAATVLSGLLVPDYRSSGRPAVILCPVNIAEMSVPPSRNSVTTTAVTWPATANAVM